MKFDTSGCVVHIVDDDPAIGKSLIMLFDSVGLKADAFGSGQEFLDAYQSTGPACMILDIRMPGMSGLELMDKLVSKKISIPVIILTGHGDVRMAVQAMKKGAYGFFEKPFRDQELIDSVQKALEVDAKFLEAKAQGSDLEKRMERLTPREREVLDLVLDGVSNRKIAESLELSPKTVEVHRSHILQKMQADSAVHLVSMFLKNPVVLSASATSYFPGLLA